MDFQLIVPAVQTKNGDRLIYFTVGTSYMVSGQPTFNVSGVDESDNTYSGTMQRGRRGEFILLTLNQIGSS